MPDERRQASLNSLRRGKEINEASEEETAWIRGRRLEETWAWNGSPTSSSSYFEAFHILGHKLTWKPNNCDDIQLMAVGPIGPRDGMNSCLKVLVCQAYIHKLT